MYSVSSSEQDLKFSTFNHRPTVKKREGLNQIIWEFSEHRNFNGLNFLRFAINNVGHDLSPTLFILDSNGKKIELAVSKEQDLSNERWNFFISTLKEDKNCKTILEDDLMQVKTIGISNLPEVNLYFSEIIGELNFENDFIICCDYFALNQSARMYVNGISYVKESWETFLSQKDYPSIMADQQYYDIISFL